MTLHLWAKKRDLDSWYVHREVRPVVCGLRVDYQSITRFLENVTCVECEKGQDEQVH